jgi:hypothetical protein
VNKENAQALFDSLPEEYQKQSYFYTDLWQSYFVFPQKRLIPFPKKPIILNVSIILHDRDYLVLLIIIITLFFSFANINTQCQLNRFSTK